MIDSGNYFAWLSKIPKAFTEEQQVKPIDLVMSSVTFMNQSWDSPSLSCCGLMIIICFIIICHSNFMLIKRENNNTNKNVIMLNIYSPSGHSRYRWVFFFIRTDLEKFSMPSLVHQWILCSEWVPSEWESKTTNKNITIIHK